MKRILFFLVVAGSLIAGTKSFTLNSTFVATIPTGAPFSTVGSFTVSGRYHNWTAPGSTLDLVNLQNVAFSLTSSSQFVITNFWEGSTAFSLSVSGITDFSFIFSRTVSTGAMQLEVWNQQTGVCTSTTTTASSPVGTINFGGSGIFNGTASARVAYWRWSAGLKAGSACAASRQPQEYDSASDLLDYEFENDLTSSSGHSATGSATSPVYNTTPTYAPVCKADPDPVYGRTFRAGQSATLDGSGSSSNNVSPTLTYAWSQLGSYQTGMSPATSTVVSPAITGLVAGSWNMQLIVTDSDMVSSTCNVHHGVVAVDAYDRITGLTDLGSYYPASGKTNADILIGPLKMNGTNPWLWTDQNALPWVKKFYDVQGTVAGGVSFEKPWETAETGTITVTNGSSTVTGVGTNFSSVFGCTAPCNPTGKYIIVWYNVPSPLPALVGRAYVGVAHLTSNTVLNFDLASPTTWGLTATQSGLSFSVMTEDQIGSWINQSANNNYYDVVMGMYTIYFQTRRDWVLTAAHWLADAFWEVPGISRYRGCDGGGGGGSNCLGPRLRAAHGMFIRALELDQAGGVGSSDRWPFLRFLIDNADDTDLNRTTYPIGGISDLREEGAQIGEVALCVLFCPITGTYGDAAKQITYAASLANTIANRWAPQQQTDGSWMGVYCKQICAYLTAASQRVTFTSTTLATISGGTWSTGNFCDAGTTAQLFTFGDSLLKATWDTRVYTVTRIDSTTASVSPAYSGTTGVARLFSLSCTDGAGVNWSGFITQPFMLNFPANAFGLAYYGLTYAGASPPFNSTVANQAKGFVGQIATWLGSNSNTSGMQPSPSRGLKYGVGGNCVWPSPAATCIGGDEEAVRTLQMEVMGTCSRAYQFSPSSGLKASCDNLYSAFAAKYPTDPGYDNQYVPGLDCLSSPKGYFCDTIFNGKWLGYQYGFGRDLSWVAARIDDIAPAPSSTFKGKALPHGSVGIR